MVPLSWTSSLPGCPANGCQVAGEPSNSTVPEIIDRALENCSPTLNRFHCRFLDSIETVLRLYRDSFKALGNHCING